MLQPQATDRAEFNLQLTRPKVLLVEYGGGKTFLGAMLGKESPFATDIISPDDLPLLTDTLKRYDVVALHTSKNLQVYTDFFSDWHSFPNRSKLESVFSDYGVVFDNGTNSLPGQLDNYGLIVLAGADIKPEDTDRLLAYVNKGGRLLIMLHAAGGKGINPPGTSNPYCILYHHPPYGDRPFPEEWLQHNTAALLTGKLGIRAMENITCTYGNMLVQKSDLSVLHNIYQDGALYPDRKIDGKDFNKLVWTTAFVDYDSSWRPILKADIRYTNEPAGHGTPIPLSVQGKTVAMGRQYGKGSVFVFGYCAMNYGTSGFPPSALLTAAPYIGSELAYNDSTIQALSNYVTQGGNLAIIGPSFPKSSGKSNLNDLLPVNISGPQVSEITRAVFRNPRHPVLNGIPPFFISHYRVTGVKANGEALVVDGKNNPVLATSYYGLGKVVYYLSEIPVQATLDNTAVPDFWRRLVLWLSPADAGTPGRNKSLAVYSGEQVPLTLQVLDDHGERIEHAEVTSEYTSPEGITGKTRLKETSPGTYVGQMSLPETGSYNLSFYVRSGTEMKTSMVDLPVKSGSLAETEHKIRQGIAFLEGYRSGAPLLVELPLWQFLVGFGVILLCIEWSGRILRREI